MQMGNEIQNEYEADRIGRSDEHRILQVIKQTNKQTNKRFSSGILNFDCHSVTLGGIMK